MSENHGSPELGGTAEETDLLERSNKRIKGNEVPSEIEMGESSAFLVITTREVVSYKDKLLGFNGDGYNFSEEEDNVQDDMSEDEDDVEEYYGKALEEKQAKVDWPIIPLRNDERRSLRSPWKKSLIINLLGKRISFKFLLAKLYKLWSGIQFKIVDLHNDHYLVKLKEKADANFILQGGPWVIAEHYLLVQRWKPKFDPYDNSVGRLAIWARIPNLPIEYYERHFLWKVGAHIGKTLKVDSNTIREAITEKENFHEVEVRRGRFARICVEIDFRKKLVSKIQIEDKLYAVEYEGLHSICFVCGKFGHKKDACPTLAKTTDTAGGPDSAEDWRNKVSVNYNSQGGERPSVGGDSFGPWMIARRASRRRSTMDAEKEPQVPATVTSGAKGRADVAAKTKPYHSERKIASGSRFSVITDLMEDPVSSDILEDATVATNNLEEKGCDTQRFSGVKKSTQMQKAKLAGKGNASNIGQCDTLSSIQNRVMQRAGKQVVGPGPGKENDVQLHLENHFQHGKGNGLRHVSNRKVVSHSHLRHMDQAANGVGSSKSVGNFVVGLESGPIPPDLAIFTGNSTLDDDRGVRMGNPDSAMEDVSGAIVLQSN